MPPAPVSMPPEWSPSPKNCPNSRSSRSSRREKVGDISSVNMLLFSVAVMNSPSIEIVVGIGSIWPMQPGLAAFIEPRMSRSSPSRISSSSAGISGMPGACGSGLSAGIGGCSAAWVRKPSACSTKRATSCSTSARLSPCGSMKAPAGSCISESFTRSLLYRCWLAFLRPPRSSRCALPHRCATYCRWRRRIFPVAS